jgi:hypothetical protein
MHPIIEKFLACDDVALISPTQGLNETFDESKDEVEDDAITSKSVKAGKKEQYKRHDKTLRRASDKKEESNTMDIH